MNICNETVSRLRRREEQRRMNLKIPPEKLGGRSKYRGQNLAYNHFARRYSPALPDVILVTRLRLQYQLLHGSRSNSSDRASKYYNAHVRKVLPCSTSGKHRFYC